MTESSGLISRAPDRVKLYCQDKWSVELVRRLANLSLKRFTELEDKLYVSKEVAEKIAWQLDMPLTSLFPLGFYNPADYLESQKAGDYYWSQARRNLRGLTFEEAIAALDYEPVTHKQYRNKMSGGQPNNLVAYLLYYKINLPKLAEDLGLKGRYRRVDHPYEPATLGHAIGVWAAVCEQRPVDFKVLFPRGSIQSLKIWPKNALGDVVHCPLGDSAKVRLGLAEPTLPKPPRPIKTMDWHDIIQSEYLESYTVATVLDLAFGVKVLAHLKRLQAWRKISSFEASLNS